MKPSQVRARVEEAEQIYYDEYLPGLQDKRLSLQRIPKKVLALLVRDCVFDQSDHKIELFLPEFKIITLQISYKPLRSLPVFSASYLSAIGD